MFKTWREKSGLTQSEAAKKMKLNAGFWCRVESGDVDLPPKHYHKVSKLFGVPIVKIINLRVSKFKKNLIGEVNECQ